MKLRLIMVLLAGATCAFLLELWRVRAGETPTSMLDAAVAELESDEPDFDGALRRLERGLRRARDEEDEVAVAEILLTRARIYRRRWDIYLTDAERAAEESDLVQVVATCREWIEDKKKDGLEEQPRLPEVLELAARSALDVGDAESAMNLLIQLEQLHERGRVTEDVVTDADLHLMRARAHQALAENRLDETLDRLRLSVPRDEVKRLAEITLSAAARPIVDPRRVALLETLRLELPEASSSRLIAEIDAASRDFGNAANRFQLTLEHEPRGEAIVGLQQVFTAADAPQMAIELAQLALTRRHDLTHRQEVIRSTVGILLDSDRRTEAQYLVEQFLTGEDSAFNPDGMMHEELYGWCELFLELEAWQPLLRAAAEIRSRNDDGKIIDAHSSEAIYYAGLATSHLMTDSTMLQGAQWSLKMLDDGGPELYPGQRIELREAIARCARELGRPLEAREALRTAAAEIPEEIEHPRVRRSAGNVYRSLGEILFDEGDFQRAEDCLTHALRLIGGIDPELSALWERCGERAIGARGRNPVAVRQQPGQRYIDGNYPPMGPYEACLRAQESIARGSTIDIGVLLVPVLDEYPGLPPALRALAEAELMRESYARAIDAQLDLAEQGLLDAAGRERLRSVPLDRFDGDQIRRWLVLDPVAAGLLPILADLAVKRRWQLLEDAVTALDSEQLTPEQRAAVAKHALDLGLYDRAHELLLALGTGSPILARRSGLALRAAAGVASERALDEATSADPGEPFAQLVERVSPLTAAIDLTRDPDLLAAIDVALAQGFGPEIIPFVEKALEARSDVRGELYLRLAFAQMEAGSPAAAEALEQADPLLDDDSAVLGRLLYELVSGNFGQVADQASRLLETELATSPVRSALLTLLAGDQLTAIERLEALAERADPASPEVPLLLAMLREWGDVKPSEFAAIALCADLAGFASWTLARLETTDASSSAPERVLLAARSWRSLGEGQRAIDLLSAHIAPDAPGVDELGPWFLLEELLRERAAREQIGSRGPAWTALLSVLAAHVERFGEDGIPPAEFLLVQARERLAASDPAGAYRLIAEGVRANPGEFVLELELARLTNRPRLRLEALQLYEDLFARHPELAAPFAPEVVALLQAARADGELTEGQVWLELDALEALLPEEPSFPCELASLRATSDDQSLDWRVQRAWDHLARFRERTDGRPIEELRPGQAEVWTALFLRFDPERAEQFAREELAANPASTELWRMWLDTLLRLGEKERALAYYDALLSIAQPPELVTARALLRLDLGKPPGEDVARLLKDRRQRDPELAMRCAIALLQRDGPDKNEDASLRAQALWETRALKNLAPYPNGWLYGLAWQRWDPETSIRIFDEALSEALDPLDSMLLAATRHLIALPLDKEFIKEQKEELQGGIPPGDPAESSSPDAPARANTGTSAAPGSAPESPAAKESDARTPADG